MDEETAIINSNTRNEKIRNFFVTNKKILLLILIVISLFDPLTGFALYFCFVHTFKHIKAILADTSKHISNKKFIFISTTVFTILTWLGGCLAIIFMSNNISFDESLIKTIFIGLAALTLPHMTLVDFFYRKKFN